MSNLQVNKDKEIEAYGVRGRSQSIIKVARAFDIGGDGSLEDNLNAISDVNDPGLLKSKSRIAAEKETFDKAYGKLVTVTIVSSFFIVF